MMIGVRRQDGAFVEVEGASNGKKKRIELMDVL